MSEMTLFQNGSTLPAHIRRGELNAITKALMGNTNKRISIEGGVWRMLVGGQEVAINEERAMNVVLVRVADYNSRTYYAGGYEKGTKVKPTCWSEDAILPSPKVKSPQCANCAQCPQHVKGSGVRENTRACRFQRRIAVVLENDIQGDIYAMSVPAASLFANDDPAKMGLQQYGRFVGGHGIDVNAVVTELRFDTQAEGVKICFKAIRPLDAAEYASVTSRHDDPAAIDAVTMTVGELDGAADAPAAPAPAPVAAKPAPIAAPVAAPVAAKPAASKPQPKASGFQVTKKAESPAAPAHVEPEEPVVRETAKTAVADVNSILTDWSDDSVDD